LLDLEMANILQGDWNSFFKFPVWVLVALILQVLLVSLLLIFCRVNLGLSDELRRTRGRTPTTALLRPQGIGMWNELRGGKKKENNEHELEPLNGSRRFGSRFIYGGSVVTI
jgi:hypothetical protein